MAFERGAAQSIGWMMYSSSDHITPTAPTGLAVQIAQDGGSWITPDGAASSVGNGACMLAASAADMTADILFLYATGTGVDPVMLVVYTESAYTSTRAGRLDAALSSRSSHSAADVDAALSAVHGAGAWGAAATAATPATICRVSGGTAEGDPPVFLQRRGDEQEFSVSCVDEAGTAIDLTKYTGTGATLKATIKHPQYRADADDSRALVQVTATSALPTSGVLTFTIPAASSELATIGVAYDIDVQGDDGDGGVITLACGTYRVLHDVTRASSATA